MKSLAAIRSGQVPAGMTPHHQRGVRLEALKVLAGRFGDQLRLGHVQDGINSSEDPEVFDAFVAQKRAEFIESELQVFDPLEIEEVFSARADAQVGALRNNHMIGLIKSYEREAVIQLDASTRDTITQALGAGDRSLDATVNDALSPETGLDAAKIGKVLTENISTDNFHSLVASGMDPRIAGKTVRDAVISLVEEEGDTDVLKILDHVDTGHGPLSNITAHKNKIEAAIDRINSENNTAFKFQQAQADRRRKVTARRLQGNGMLALERSRTARVALKSPDLTDEQKAEASVQLRADIKAFEEARIGLQKIDSEKAKMLFSYREAVFNADAKIRRDPAIEFELFEQLDDADADGEEIIQRYVVARLISPEVASQALNYFQKNKDNENILQSGAYKEAKTDLIGLLKATGEFGLTPGAEKLSKAGKAKRMLRAFVLTWRKENADDKGRFDGEAFQVFVDSEVDRIASIPRFGISAAISSSFPKPTDEAVTFLRNNPTPDNLRDFDLKFGPGRAKEFLQ